MTKALLRAQFYLSDLFENVQLEVFIITESTVAHRSF